MSRYIDTEKIEYDKHERIGLGIDYGLNERSTYYTTTKEKIDSIPTADVVEVVRCKDCKYRYDDGMCWGRGVPLQLVPDNGFCDKGERSEDGKSKTT